MPLRGVIIDKGKDEGDSKDHVRSRELVDGSGNAQMVVVEMMLLGTWATHFSRYDLASLTRGRFAASALVGLATRPA